MQNPEKHPEENPKSFNGKRALLMDWLMKEIQSGNLKPGSVIPSRNTLTDKFDCSYATVDFVLKSLIRQKILVAERGKATYVASQKERQAVDAIATVNCNPVFTWSEEVLQGLLGGLENGTTCHNYSIFDLGFPSTWSACKSHKSVVFLFPDAHHSLYLEELQMARIPHLVLYRNPPESPFISIDHRASAKALVAALKAEGRRRLAWFAWEESRYKAPETKYEGFLEGLLNHGLAFRNDWVSFSRPREAGYMRSLFAGPEKPDALVMAHPAIDSAAEAILAAGLAPGKDVRLACLDEVAPGQYPFPVLCVEKLTKEIGLEAAKILADNEELINGGLLQRYLTPRVLER